MFPILIFGIKVIAQKLNKPVHHYLEVAEKVTST